MSNLLNCNLGSKDWLITQSSEDNRLLSNPLLKKDIWQTVEDLGLKTAEHNKVVTLNFKQIKQKWLKLLIKLYILARSSHNLSPKHFASIISCVNNFSAFIQKKSIDTDEQINNYFFEEYNYYLKTSKFSEKTISNYFNYLRVFLNWCRQEGWLNINTYWFKGKTKTFKPNNNAIEYIPEEVWQQLDECLHYLPEPVQRMVIVIRSTGLRIGELLNLPLDCLRKRGHQWRIRFVTEKYKVEDEIPICTELVAVVQEQQEYIRYYFNDKYNNLFSSYNIKGEGQPVCRVMQIDRLNDFLNKIAKENNIFTKEGKLWHFKSHQFRKTVATVMTNAGIRDLIIQKYLRHRSLDMQHYYKHLIKQVLGDEYQELMQETKYVDSMGKLVITHKPKDLITELLRRRMYQITTQYGECHRPILKSPCQTVNACWQCEHWLTSNHDLEYLKKDLYRIEAELKIATEQGLNRQQQGLMNDQQKLRHRIQGLDNNYV